MARVPAIKEVPMGTSNDQPQNVASISDEEKQSTLRKMVFSSFLGNFIEWFDYGSYSYFAAVIGAVFFPADDPLITFGTCVLKAVGFYAVLTFMPACLTDVLECDAGQATLITNILLAAYILFIFASGCISDKVGRKKMIIIAAADFVILTVPMFLLIGTMSFGLILVAKLVMNALLTINDGTQAFCIMAIALIVLICMILGHESSNRELGHIE